MVIREVKGNFFVNNKRKCPKGTLGGDGCFYGLDGVMFSQVFNLSSHLLSCINEICKVFLICQSHLKFFLKKILMEQSHTTPYTMNYIKT